jgi:hypothetical protein
MASDYGIFSSIYPSSQRIMVGNGQSIYSTHVGSTSIPSSSSIPLSLRNILIVPHIIKNLISVRQFTIDNSCSIEFDPFGFSVNALPSKIVILRCNSPGPLYPLCPPSSTNEALTAATTSSSLWHRRLGHPGQHTMPRLHQSKSIISSNKDGPPFVPRLSIRKTS